MPAPASTTRFKPATYVQAEHLREATLRLHYAGEVAGKLRSTENTKGTWMHVAQHARDSGLLAVHDVTDAYRLYQAGVKGAVPFADIDLRSTAYGAVRALDDAMRPDLTPLGRSRRFGRAADQLIAASEAARGQYELVARQVGGAYGTPNEL